MLLLKVTDSLLFVAHWSFGLVIPMVTPQGTLCIRRMGMRTASGPSDTAFHGLVSLQPPSFNLEFDTTDEDNGRGKGVTENYG